MTLTLTRQSTEFQAPPTLRDYYQGGHKLKIRTLSGKFTYSPLFPRAGSNGGGTSANDGDSPMGLSGVANSRKPPQGASPPRAPRGSSGLTKVNRELLEDGAIAIWNYVNGRGRRQNHQAVFLTLTIPSRYHDGEPLTKSDINRICEGWGELVKRLFEEIARLQERLGIPTRWLYVIEPQEGRFKHRQEFAPHIHALVLNRWDKNKISDRGFSRGAYSITPTETDALWGRLLNNLLGKPVKVDSACNLGTIQGLGGLFGYLTKLGKISRYCSKGSQLLPGIKRAGYTLPRSWAGADRGTRGEVKESRLEFLATDTIGEIKARLEQFNQDYQEQTGTGKPLFTGIFEVKIDALPFPVSLIFRVRGFQNIQLGQSVLEFLLDPLGE